MYASTCCLNKLHRKDHTLTCCHQVGLKVHVLVAAIFTDSYHSEDDPLWALLINDFTRTDLGYLVRHL